MYRPKLKYVFCMMRKRSLMTALSVMRYMNSVGLTPQILMNGVEYHVDQRAAITGVLNRYNVKFKEIK